MNISAARRALREKLRVAGIENAKGEADLILIRLLDSSQSKILGHPEKILTDAQTDAAFSIVRRREAGEPLQYILKEAYFWGTAFQVGPGVLVPRPETELLVELALEYLPLRGNFLDWGTGSGCIAISLLTERPHARGIMAEKNPLSLSWAWKNLTEHGPCRYDQHERSLLWHSREPEDIPVARNSLDLVVSNPPYIPTEDIPNLMREVKDHEPHPALDGGKDGMDFYRLLFRCAPAWLKKGGALVFEIGGATQESATQGSATQGSETQSEKMRSAAPPGLKLVKEVTDYSGIPRCMAWVSEISP
jgi:release factor glutamine methyltransferase